MSSALGNLCRNVSFAPSELGVLPFHTHGLRRGLHSFAAPRLRRRGVWSGLSIKRGSQAYSAVPGFPIAALCERSMESLHGRPVASDLVTSVSLQCVTSWVTTVAVDEKKKRRRRIAVLLP